LELSIEEQLFADVQTSVLLSGGLDSSLVTALASNVKNNIQTFSVSFSKDKKNDEIEYANQIAKYYNTSHNVLNVGEASLGSLIEICENIDEPFIDSSMIPTFFLAREVGKHTKVVLGGDGADELFGGYNHYKRLASLDKIHKNQLFRKTLNASSFVVNKFESDSNRFKWLDIACQNLNCIVPKTAIYFRNPHKLLKSKIKISNKEIKHDDRLLEASMEFDFNNYLPSDILVKVDRAMMSASVESRSPFLDKRVIEFAYSRTPLNKKINNNNGKIILQDIAKKLLPKDYEFGRKQGFNFNIGALMANKEIISYMKEELDVLSLFENSLFENLVNKNKHNHNHGEKLYGLFVLAFWLKKNKVEWTF
jgi:asparagine synthase (glutamine-hydrolysing)